MIRDVKLYGWGLIANHQKQSHFSGYKKNGDSGGSKLCQETSRLDQFGRYNLINFMVCIYIYIFIYYIYICVCVCISIQLFVLNHAWMSA